MNRVLDRAADIGRGFQRRSRGGSRAIGMALAGQRLTMAHQRQGIDV
jgi:hypothetical protein